MPRGRFGGGGFRGRGFGMRRVGAPLIGIGGVGSPLLNTLVAGGLGYVLGSNAAQQTAPQPVVVPYPTYQPNPYQGPPTAPQGPTTSAVDNRLAQLKLLGELRQSGLLSDEEFEREKQRILQG